MLAAATPMAIQMLIVVLGLTSLWLGIAAVATVRAGVWPLPERPAAPAPWHPYAVLGLFVLGMLLIPALLQSWWEVGPGPSLLKIQIQVLSGLSVLPLAPLVLWTPRLRPEDFGLHRDGWQLDLQAGVWGFLLALVPVYLSELPVSLWRTPHTLLEVLGPHPTREVIAWAVLSAVVVAPLFEELLFRVVLQGLLARQSPVAGIICTALVFALVHGWADAVPLFPLALILGYVYHRRHSYLAVVTIHALFNGLNLSLALASPEL